ncbi:hypothetical protein [Planococcus lenghuensis]|uniref:Uncharacterized protein n=1 Tax=Planococcus lenghuensis TaxID=2213202 RepID=A0A1Q2KUG0_9BACL|nr:hypothetical protein [Planococcus lenghuensis]AQQ51848.1 hypothetical protein B0X71_01085 [Planococcus lenghuensis]
MKKLFFFGYLISAGLTVLLFYSINGLTEPLGSADGTWGGGNGNPGIFPLVFLWPFLCLFLYGTTAYSMRLMKRAWPAAKIRVSAAVFALLAIGIAVYQVAAAQAVRKELIRLHPSFNEDHLPSLLNTYTNSIFFNLLTFIMIVLFCLLAGCLWALVRMQEPGGRQISPRYKRQ